MSAQHYAETEVLADGYASVRFTCTGGPEHHCRQWCAEGCEEACTAFVGDEGKRHRWEFRADAQEPCREVEWLDAVGWQDSGWVDEPDVGGEREMTAADLRPGLHPIETEWTGDDYIWRYPADAAVDDAGVPL